MSAQHASPEESLPKRAMNPRPDFNLAQLDYSSRAHNESMHENVPSFIENARLSEEAILDAAACAHSTVVLDPHSETLRRALAVMLGLVQRTRAYHLLIAKDQAIYEILETA